ncbi:MAG TPA: glycoside-pentoside-hexuronide (GPH):cation symporter [Anaerolineales bacterium]|nr:glycoside-pentoside-hexuronide (GPH):cation symporter [Anaerolineales bacterium]
MAAIQGESHLPLWKRLIYGTGDWSTASFGTLRQLFYAIFLTDVVGLEPRLASFVALVGILWDAINDPIVGTLTDRVRTRWGRRRPFLLFFAIPYGASFLLFWWAPPIENQVLLAIVVCIAFILADSLQTLVYVPFISLLPEIAPEYDGRTELTGFRMFFNLLSSLVTAVAAPAIVDSILASGGTQQQGYMLIAALFGGMAALPFLLIFAAIRERTRSADEQKREQETPFMEAVRTAWSNIPFRVATALYMLNWITFDLVGLSLPFFLTYWVARGNLLEKALGLPIESAVFALLLITSLVVLPFWIWLSHRLSKRNAYIFGMAFWAVVQLLIFSIQPGQINYVLVLAVLAGISVSSAHVLPDAMFPDVIEWDELRTGRRQEGIYYGVMNFVRKTTGALAIFIALQVLGWFGYQTPPEGATSFQQSATTLGAIRFLIGPLGAALLFSAITMAFFYPLTRERHARIRSLLARKKGRIAP